MPCLLVRSLIICKSSFGVSLIPPSPCIGSISTAAVLLEIFSSNCCWDSSIFSKPEGRGPNPSVCLGFAPAAKVAKVLPWNAFLKVMMSVLSLSPFSKWYFLEVLIAPSTASAPELQKNTLSAKLISHNFLANFCCSGIWYRFETCQTLSIAVSYTHLTLPTILLV